MRASLLEVLRCPFCGGSFHLAGAPIPQASVESGVLCCACCAYPIIDGIPVVRLSDEVTAAVKALDAGQLDAARHLVLDLPPERHAEFDAVGLDPGMTFAVAVRRLLPDGEGDYYVLRFGDPTFVVASAVARAIVAMLPVGAGRLVDVCGGCGHLSWTLASLVRVGSNPPPALLDRSFWRLWLASRFVAPDADVVVCDANVPLPLDSSCAALALCNDAVHYVWGKRLLAAEMQRIVGPRGWCAWTHVHNALGNNATAGNTLSPSQYAALFDVRAIHLADERALLEAAIGGGALPWLRPGEASACDSADAVTLVAARHGGDLMVHAVAGTGHLGVLAVNPAYDVERTASDAHLRLRLPSVDYETEFAALGRYLPASLDVPAAALDDLEALARARPDLLVHRVLLRLPPRYL